MQARTICFVMQARILQLASEPKKFASRKSSANSDIREISEMCSIRPSTTVMLKVKI